ncbi:MAG: rRNA maturation RNase YbeY [Acidimicrobiales bacterium]
MPVDVFCADEQSTSSVDLERLGALARFVLENRGLRSGAEVSILFVDPPAIAALNERFLGRVGPTDVLSFPVEDDLMASGRFPDAGGNGPGAGSEEQPPLLLGDVVICPEVATSKATELGVPAGDNLELLVVHGLLHLLGMDHEIDAEAEVMEALERELLSAFAARP